MTIRHLVFDTRLARRLIQPALPFGRPESRTRSQRSPPRPVRWASTGSTVRTSVIGRRAGTSATNAEPLAGFDNALCGANSVTSVWLGLTVGAVALSGAAWADVASSTSHTKELTATDARHERTGLPSARSESLQPVLVNRSDRRSAQVVLASAAGSFSSRAVPASSRHPAEASCPAAAASCLAGAAPSPASASRSACSRRRE